MTTLNGMSLPIRLKLRITTRYSLHFYSYTDSNSAISSFADCDDKASWAGPLVATSLLTMIKISTLFLYQRIFVLSPFRQACSILIGLTFGWFLASVFVGADCKYLPTCSDYWCSLIQKGPNFLIQARISRLDRPRV